jgi:hypothetical protein
LGAGHDGEGLCSIIASLGEGLCSIIASLGEGLCSIIASLGEGAVLAVGAVQAEARPARATTAVSAATEREIGRRGVMLGLLLGLRHRRA